MAENEVLTLAEKTRKLDAITKKFTSNLDAVKTFLVKIDERVKLLEELYSKALALAETPVRQPAPGGRPKRADEAPAPVQRELEPVPV
jgi:hypothetical protein